MLRALPILLAMALLAAPAPSAASPVSHPPCGDPAVVSVFASGQGVLENLLFDGAGRLLVSGDGALWSYAPNGSRTQVAPGVGGGLALGRDGLLYAGALNSAAESALRTHRASVWRFTSLAPAEHEVHATGFDMANGLAFDAAGNLYVSNDLGDAIVRVAPEGTWAPWAEVYSANGLVVDDAAGVLYAATTFDQSSRIYAVSLADPSDVRLVAELSVGALTLRPGAHVPSALDAPVVPKGLDDMTMGADGRLYVAANLAGEVLRVDPASGSACVLVSGLQNPSSLRFARGFGGHDGALFVTGFDGTLKVVAL